MEGGGRTKQDARAEGQGEGIKTLALATRYLIVARSVVRLLPHYLDPGQ